MHLKKVYSKLRGLCTSCGRARCHHLGRWLLCGAYWGLMGPDIRDRAPNRRQVKSQQSADEETIAVLGRDGTDRIFYTLFYQV